MPTQEALKNSNELVSLYSQIMREGKVLYQTPPATAIRDLVLEQVNHVDLIAG